MFQTRMLNGYIKISIFLCTQYRFQQLIFPSLVLKMEGLESGRKIGVLFWIEDAAGINKYSNTYYLWRYLISMQLVVRKKVNIPYGYWVNMCVFSITLSSGIVFYVGACIRKHRLWMKSVLEHLCTQENTNWHPQS